MRSGLEKPNGSTGPLCASGRELLADPDPGGALFALLAAMVQAAQTDRALFEAVADIRLASEDIRAAHSELVDTLD